jgi:hypothetical protein
MRRTRPRQAQAFVQRSLPLGVWYVRRRSRLVARERTLRALVYPVDPLCRLAQREARCSDGPPKASRESRHTLIDALVRVGRHGGDHKHGLPVRP